MQSVKNQVKSLTWELSLSCAFSEDPRCTSVHFLHPGFNDFIQGANILLNIRASWFCAAGCDPSPSRLKRASGLTHSNSKALIIIVFWSLPACFCYRVPSDIIRSRHAFSVQNWCGQRNTKYSTKWRQLWISERSRYRHREGRRGQGNWEADKWDKITSCTTSWQK